MPLSHCGAMFSMKFGKINHMLDVLRHCLDVKINEVLKLLISIEVAFVIKNPLYLEKLP